MFHARFVTISSLKSDQVKQLEPHAHQLVARDFLAARQHALLGDDPGLEKTLSLILATEAVSAKSILVSCPASVRTNWYEHFEMRRGHTRGVDVVSYSSSGSEKWRSGLRDKYDAWLGDEIQFCKNLESKRTQAIFGNGAKGLARRAHYKWCGTGTWAPNHRPVELYPVLKFMHPAFRGMKFDEYARIYCGAYFDGRALNVKGATRLDELEGLLQGFMLRRTEDEVYPDRVQPLVHKVPVELSKVEMAAIHAEEDAIGGRPMRISSRFDEFSQLGDTAKLLRLLGLAKAARVAEFVDDLLERVDKVVVFAHHVDVIAHLCAHFSERGVGWTVYRGGMSDEHKAANVRSFAHPSVRVFIGQDQAAGTGINGLQDVCSTVVFAEWSWVPGDTNQRVRRLARTGQKEKLVNAYLLYARGTLDAVQVAVHDRKELVGERIVLSSNESLLNGL